MIMQLLLLLLLSLFVSFKIKYIKLMMNDGWIDIIKYIQLENKIS
jgi:hypothetical protein